MHRITATQVASDQREDSRIVEPKDFWIRPGLAAEHPLWELVGLGRWEASLAPRSHQGHEQRNDTQERHQQE